MKPSQLSSFLARAIPARLPILITGAPGIGKSQIVEQACRAAGADLIVSHPVVSDPTDIKGLPWPDASNGHARFLPFGDAHRALTATKLTIWLLDDIGQASPMVQASYMQPILGRNINGVPIPDCLTFIAATNRRVDRAGVSGILEPVKSRFAAIVELEANIDDWTAWAISENLPAEVISFLRFKSELLCKFEPTSDLTNSPLPRTWSHVAKLLALGLPAEVQHAAIAGAVGAGAAVEFAAFLQLFQQLPNIDAILANPEKAPIPTVPAILYAIVTSLALRADKATFKNIGRYAERLTDAEHGEFATLLVLDCVRKDPSLMQTSAFVKLSAGKAGELWTGGRS